MDPQVAVRTVLLALRAGLFAAVCVALAAVGHALAASAPVGPLALGAGFSAVLAAALVVGRRERSQAAITVGLVVGQLGLHLLFTRLDEHSLAVVHHHGAVTAAPGSAGWTMLLGHLVAGLLAGWWLQSGEASCWRSVRRLETVVGALRWLRLLASLLAGAAPRDVLGTPRPAAPGCSTPRAPTLIQHSLVRRGPPRRT